MAGSYDHIVDKEGRFIGTRLIDNLGDAYEALEECYGMIQWLANGHALRVTAAKMEYKQGLKLGGVNFAGSLDDDDEKEDTHGR